MIIIYVFWKEAAETGDRPEVRLSVELTLRTQWDNFALPAGVSGSLRNYKSASEIAGSEMPLYGDKAEQSGEGGTEEDKKGTLLHFVTVRGCPGVLHVFRFVGVVCLAYCASVEFLQRPSVDRYIANSL